MISERLTRVLERELGLTGSGVKLEASTVASEVPGWDSLRHLKIIAAVEKEFEVRFRSLEVLRLRSVGDLQALVDRKIAR
jgi:acyl carrier protein